MSNFITLVTERYTITSKLWSGDVETKWQAKCLGFFECRR